MYLAKLKTKCMKRNKQIALFLVLISFWSCRNDDDGLPDVEVVPPRPLSEVAAEDDAKIQEYLRTHFYNIEQFENPPANFNFNIIIDTIDEENQDKISIWDSDELTFVDINVSSDRFLGIPEENNIPHRLYYLPVREGEGERPTVVDSVYLKYEGFRLNNQVFDTNVAWFDLQGTGTQSNSGSFVIGFEEGLTFFKDGTELINNNDGTFEIPNSGIGVIFMPSGLGYFNSSRQVGEAYAPLGFKIDLLETNVADHDRDGVPSLLEDLDNDLDLFNDDTNDNGLPNYLDPDDDGDGILTIEEIELDADGNFVGFKDTDGDGTFDHLDSDS